MLSVYNHNNGDDDDDDLFTQIGKCLGGGIEVWCVHAARIFSRCYFNRTESIREYKRV